MGTKDRLIAGKHKLRLTKAGTERLTDYRDRQRERQQLAALPDDIEALIADYKATLARRHAAIMGPEWQHIEGTAIHGKREDIVARETRRLDLLQIKANGGTRSGMACHDSSAERLRAAAAAPIGEVPLWGQRGMFRLEVDGLACLATHNEHFYFEALACSDAPFISETGYRSFLGARAGAASCVTVHAQAAAFVREEMVGTLDHQSVKRKPRKGAMPTPERWYRLPGSWDEARAPICADDGAGESDELVGKPVEVRALIRRGEAEPASDPGLWAGLPIDPTDPGPIPDGIRRDADNRAPFMDAQQTGNGAGDGPCVAASHDCPVSEAAPAAAEHGDGSAADSSGDDAAMAEVAG